MNQMCTLVVVVALCYCGQASAETEEEAVVQVLQAYEAAWSQHDAHAVASFYRSSGNDLEN